MTDVLLPSQGDVYSLSFMKGTAANFVRNDNPDGVDVGSTGNGTANLGGSSLTLEADGSGDTAFVSTTSVGGNYTNTVQVVRGAFTLDDNDDHIYLGVVRSDSVDPGGGWLDVAGGEAFGYNVGTAATFTPPSTNSNYEFLYINDRIKNRQVWAINYEGNQDFYHEESQTHGRLAIHPVALVSTGGLNRIRLLWLQQAIYGANND